jgi:hypothetical protein
MPNFGYQRPIIFVLSFVYYIIFYNVFILKVFWFVKSVQNFILLIPEHF